jgi:hypothetical protein
LESILDKIQKEQHPINSKADVKAFARSNLDVSTEERVKHCTESFPSPKTTLAMLLDVSTKSEVSAHAVHSIMCSIHRSQNNTEQ